MFLAVGSEPPFNIAMCCGFADFSAQMFDPVLLAVRVEA
jgi:hypothetical protein